MWIERWLGLVFALPAATWASASVYASVHPRTRQGQADRARGDLRWGIAEVQRAVCGVLFVPWPAVAPGHMHWPVWGTTGDLHHQHRCPQQVEWLTLQPLNLMEGENSCFYSSGVNPALCSAGQGGKRAQVGFSGCRSSGNGAWDWCRWHLFPGEWWSADWGG